MKNYAVVCWLLSLVGLFLVGSTQVAGGTTPSRRPISSPDLAHPSGATPPPTPACGPPGTTPWTLVAPQPQPARLVSLAATGSAVYRAGGHTPGISLTQFARYAPLSDTWTLLSPLPTAAEGGLLVYAPNTDQLYLFGGVNGNTPLTTTQVFDLATQTWAPGVPLPAPRSVMTGGYWNGKIYLVGGSDTIYFNPRNELWEYDPLAQTWNTSLPVHPTGILGAAGGILDGHLLVAGGANSLGQAQASVYDYDLTAQQWGTLPGLLTATYGAGSAVVNGQLWVFGGGQPLARAALRLLLDQAAPTALDLTQIYDPFTTTWQDGPALNGARALTAGTNIGNQVVAAGGLNNGADLATVEVASSLPNTPCPTVTRTPTPTGTPPTATATVTATPTQCGIWGTIDPWTSLPGYPPAIRGPGLGNDGARLLLAGGDAGAAHWGIRRAALFDPAANTWTPRPTLIFSTGYASLIYAPNVQKFYYFGGIYWSFAEVFTQVYNPATDSWAAGAPLPQGRAFFGTAYDQGQIYVVGGTPYETFSARNNLWRYDPTADLWDTTFPPLPQARLGVATGVINGHLWVAGGADATQQPRGTLFDYDIAARTWYTRTPLLQPVFAPVSAVIGGRLWVIGGGTPFLGGGPAAAPAALATVQIYDPATDTWSWGTPLPEPRSHGAATQIGNRVYVFGGGDSSYTSDFLYTDFHPGVPCVTPSATFTANPSPTHTPLPTISDPTPSPASPTATATPCLLQFSDVPATDPFYPYIHCLACRGVLSGYSDGRFRPGAAITRGQASKVVANAAGLADPIPPAQQTFRDVPLGSPFWPFIERLVAQGWVSGYADGTFGPGALVTRGQLAKLLSNAAGWTDPPTSQVFADVPPSDPFYVYIGRAAAHGVISGYACGAGFNPCTGQAEVCDSGNRPYYRPCAPATRGQAAKLVANTFYPGCALR